VDRTRLHEPQPAAGLEGAVDHPYRRDDTPVGVVVGVEDEGLQWCVGIADGRRHPLDDGI
jgi:hypothetical protein